MARLVQGVSYPRSGHGLLVRSLGRYFSADREVRIHRERLGRIRRRLGRLEMALRRTEPDAFFYCEYYKHCQRVPCVDRRTRLSKNHDFGLKMDSAGDVPYLVQIRDPLPALVSWFELSVGEDRVTDDVDSWQGFAETKAGFYRGFRRKWVEPGESAELMIIGYADLVAHPVEMVRRAISYIFPDEEVDHARLSAVIDEMDVGETREIERFRFYEADFFAHLEDLAGPVT